MADATSVNALVFDTKQEGGRVFYDTSVTAAHEFGAVVNAYDPAERIAQARERGLYVITRIVTFEDWYWAEARPEIDRERIGTADQGSEPRPRRIGPAPGSPSSVGGMANGSCCPCGGPGSPRSRASRSWSRSFFFSAMLEIAEKLMKKNLSTDKAQKDLVESYVKDLKVN